MDMVFHRAEPEELRDKTAVGVSGWSHSGVRLEPVDQVGEGSPVDARDDFDHATISVAPAEASALGTSGAVGVVDQVRGRDHTRGDRGP
ncbi:hypothetical protein ACFZCL_09445 [Streptomyces sp. NPDC008159]|uniref:hypothetical protein n=1 Tax=Streptomyces sp. NPDC008159 TaxID=3364817 RepID=UPI0036EE091B